MPTHMVLGFWFPEAVCSGSLVTILMNRVDSPKSLLERCLLGSHMSGSCFCLLCCWAVICSDPLHLANVELM